MPPKKYLLYGSERYALAILRPLQQAIRQRGDLAAWFFDGPGADELTDDERLLNVSQVRAWQPDVVLTGSNAVPHFFSGIKVQTFHGFNAGKPRHVYIRGFFDVYCTSGPEDTAAFKAKAGTHGHFAVHETGWPKLDPFLAQLAEQPPPVRDPPVILYHSTFSPSWSAAEILYETIRDLAKTKPWRWIVTFHPKMDPDTVARYRALESDGLRFSDVDNIWELFPHADLMCSDTSSALNEFLLTHKPVVTFRNRRPGPQLLNIDAATELAPAIERALARPPELMAAIRAYAQQIHPFRDGRSSERVLDAITYFDKHEKTHLDAKPINFWRKLKLRRRLRYWGPR